MKEFTVHMNVDGKYIRRHFRTEFEQCSDGKWRLMCGVFLKESHSVEEFDSLEEGYDFVLKNPDYRFNFNEPEYEQDFLDELEKNLNEFLSKNQREITAKTTDSETPQQSEKEKEDLSHKHSKNDSGPIS